MTLRARADNRAGSVTHKPTHRCRRASWPRPRRLASERQRARVALSGPPGRSRSWRADRGALCYPTTMHPPLAFRPHPWQGIDPGPRYPEIVVTYIEIVPADGVKYEIDKHSGYLHIDRPQRFSSACPTLYGFVPRTYCGDVVAAYKIPGGPSVTHGDGDPLDVCVLTDRNVSRGDILLEARPIGGLRLGGAGPARRTTLSRP